MTVPAPADGAATPDRTPPALATPDQDVRAFRADFFKALRASVDPKTLGFHGTPGPLRSHAPTFSQSLCALLMGVSEKTLRNLESGASQWTAQLVRRFEQAAGLAGREDPQAWDWRTGLWGVALGRRPPGAFPALNTVDRLILGRRRASDPTFMMDDAWNLLACNQAALAWFPPWREGVNTLEYTLGPVGEATFLDWERDWVAPICAWLRLTMAFSGVHDVDLYRNLVRIMARLRERSEVVERQWHVRQYAPGPDWSTRRLTVPVYAPGPGRRETGRREATVIVGTIAKMGTVNTRITTLFEQPLDIAEGELFIAPSPADA